MTVLPTATPAVRVMEVGVPAVWLPVAPRFLPKRITAMARGAWSASSAASAAPVIHAMPLRPPELLVRLIMPRLLLARPERHARPIGARLSAYRRCMTDP